MKHGISLEIMKLREKLSMKHDSIHQVEDLLVTDRNEACRYSKILESDLPYLTEEGDTEDVFVISPDFIIRNGITPVIQIIEVK